MEHVGDERVTRIGWVSDSRPRTKAISGQFALDETRAGGFGGVMNGRRTVWRTRRAWVYKGVDLGRPNWKSRLMFPIIYLQKSRRKTYASSGPTLTSNLDRRDKPRAGCGS